MKPLWVEGPDPAYPAEAFLCAAGVGAGREAATHAAYGAISKTFLVQVHTSSSDDVAHHQATGQAERTVQNVQVQNRLQSQASLQGVSVYETWAAPDGLLHAWACLDRQRTATSLRQQIGALDQQAGTLLQEAAAADKAARLRPLGSAVEALAARDALIAQWRWAAPKNAALPALQSKAGEAGARLAQALSELRIGLWTEGIDNAACRAALVQSMAARGYRAAPIAQRADFGAYDLLVVATTEMEDAGSTRVGAVPMQLARGLVQVEIRRGDAVLLAYEATHKAGSGSAADARRRVLRGLAGRINEEFGPKIDAAVRGTASQVDL